MSTSAVPPADSIAEGVCANDPVIGGQRVLQAVRESGGLVLAVSEDEIVEAVRLLAEREGLAMEATGAVALAGLLKLSREANPWTGQTLVVSITGHGLNSVETGGRLAPPPAVVDAEYRAIQKVLVSQDLI
jgi:threonine synthase